MKTFKRQFRNITTLIGLLMLFSMNDAISRDRMWSKLELESRVEGKLQTVLAKFIAKEKFIVDVQLQLKDIPKQEILQQQGFNQSFTLDDNNVLEAAKPDIVFNDEDQANGDDYILFNKFGLDAPIRLSFDDGSKQRSLETLRSQIKSQMEIQRLQRLIDSQSQKQQDDSIKDVDITNQVSKIVITIYFDTSVENDQLKNINTVIQNLSYLSGVPKEVNPVKVPIIPVVEKVEEEIVKEKDPAEQWMEILSKFSVPIGLVLAVLIFGMFAFSLFNRYLGLIRSENEAMGIGMGESTSITEEENNTIDTVEQHGGHSQSDINTTIDTAIAGADGSAERTVSELVKDPEAMVKIAVARFTNYVNKDPQLASTSIKKWIRSDEVAARKSLVILAKEVESEVLLKLFNHLSGTDRDIWKSYLNEIVDIKQMKEAAMLIDLEVLEEVIAPVDFVDTEMKIMLTELAPQDGAGYISENDNKGAMLMNILSSSFILKMMPYFPHDKISEIMQRSTMVKIDQVREHILEIKEDIKQFMKDMERSPFVDIIKDVIPKAKSDSEFPLYQALGVAGEKDLLRKLISDCLPGFLIKDLPNHMMKTILLKIPRKQLVKILVSLDNDETIMYLDIIGGPNNKVREVIDLEMEEITEDELAVKRINGQKEELWGIFLDFARRILRANDDMMDEIEILVEKWVEICTGERDFEAPSKDAQDDLDFDDEPSKTQVNAGGEDEDLDFDDVG